MSNEGKKVPDYTKITNLPTSSIERYIKLLKDADFIYFSDESTKLGGYYISNKIKEIIQ